MLRLKRGEHNFARSALVRERDLSGSFRSAFRAAAIVVTLLGASCVGSDLDANPFYVGRVRASDRGAVARTHSLGPLWDDARSPDRTETALHPIWRATDDGHERRWQFLYPFFGGRSTDRESGFHFLGLSFGRSRRTDAATGSDGDDAADRDFMLFPFLWWGRGKSDHDRYFALFPLGGQIDDFATFAQIGFVLFPLYYYAKKEVPSPETPETFENITPLIGWIHGGPRAGSVHVLPLFGHWKWDGKYDKWSILWPIFWWQRNRLDTRDPSTDIAVWPLFGLEKSERMRFLTLLWPFFRFRIEQVGEETYFHDDFLWPLYRKEHARDHDYFTLFPFYSHYVGRDLESECFAIPLFWKRTTTSSAWTKKTFDAVPLIHWERKQWNERAGETAATRRADDSAFRLWPLFSVADEQGAHEVKVPALLPLDVDPYTGDFEANWGPWYELWHTRREADGSASGSALLRLFDWEQRDERSRFSLPLVYSYDRSGRDEAERTHHSLLLGLFRFGGGAGGPELKVLGLPLMTPDTPAPAKDGSR